MRSSSVRCASPQPICILAASEPAIAMPKSSGPTATITSASYDVNTGILSVVHTAGSTDFLDYTKLTFTGAGGPYTVTANSAGATGQSAGAGFFSVTLSAADRTALKNVLDHNGLVAGNGTTAFNLSAAAGWDTVDSPNTDTTTPVTVSGWVAPTTTVATVLFSNDTGSSTTDFITKTALQTNITGTTSAPLVLGELVQISLDNGGTWATATGFVGDTAWQIGGLSLTASNTLQVRVTTNGGSSTALTQAYVLDTTAPTAAIATATLNHDNGSSGTDFITNTAGQDISGTYTGTLGTGETVQVSVDNGSTWTNAVADAVTHTWSSAGLSLLPTSTGTLKVQVADTAGNASTAFSQAYVLDTTAPGASTIFLSAGSDTGASSQDGITRTTTPTFSGLAEINSTVKLFDGTTLVATATANGTNGNWVVATSALAAGPHSITAVSTDVAGNTGVASVALVLNVDLTAPVLASATVNGGTLVMTYGEALDAIHVPGNGAFAVQVGGAADAVTAVAVDSVAKTVTLTLTTAASSGQVVTVGYTDPTIGDDTSGIIQDVAGNDAATLTAQAVTNNTPAPPSSGGGAPGVTLTTPAAGGTVTGGAGNDILVGRGGNDVLNRPWSAQCLCDACEVSALQRAGIDTAVVGGARTDYTLVHNSDGSFVLQSKADANTTISLTNMERISFNGQTLALDVTPTSAKVADMYMLALGRNPEDAGLGYWNDMLVGGQGSLALAKGFTNSKEFASLYGGLGDAAFITQFYANAFGRAPDAGGMAFYLDALSHTTGLAGRAIMLANFVDSPEMQVKLAGQIDQGIPLLATA